MRSCPAIILFVFISHLSFAQSGSLTLSDLDLIVHRAGEQYMLMIENNPDVSLYPRTTNADGTLKLVGPGDWTSGFSPGSLWFLYEHTGGNYWLDQAIERSAGIEGQKFNTGTHDLGFMLGCSFGNGYRLTGDPDYRDILIQAAGSLASRFNANIGCIRSWDFGSWEFPVIIDNMMNLELLFLATELTGDSSYRDKAISHADVTLLNHYRYDFSSYHVVDYSKTTGNPIGKYTHQGYSAESAWARGQAWGLYGFTMSYRFTRDTRYLDLAEEIALFLLEHDHMPDDLISYWDFDAHGIPNEPRDVAAAAIICSALFELSKYSETYGATFLQTAISQINSFSSEDYTAATGANSNFILMHGTGNYPANKEIDVPLNYADYYYLEALIRYRRYLNATGLSQVIGDSGEKSPEVSVYPNPASECVTIELPGEVGKSDAYIIGTSGQKFAIELVQGTNSIRSGDWANGIYILQFPVENENYVEKLVILHR